MKTKVEIIKETIEYYKTHDRAVSRNGCKYSICGKMCAVGRCCIDPEYVELKYSGKNVYEIPLESLLKSEYLGHSNKFWGELQSLHDNGNFWDNYELTRRGEEYVTRLLLQYGQ